MQEITDDMIGFVTKYSAKIWHTSYSLQLSISVEDWIQEARLTLCEAAHSYEFQSPSRHTETFKKYVTHKLQNHIMKVLYAAKKYNYANAGSAPLPYIIDHSFSEEKMLDEILHRDLINDSCLTERESVILESHCDRTPVRIISRDVGVGPLHTWAILQNAKNKLKEKHKGPTWTYIQKIFSVKKT